MLPIPQSDWRRAEALASWVELSALSVDNGFVARGTVLDAFNDSGLFANGAMRRGEANDSTTEWTAAAMVADIWVVLNARHRLIGEAWPFLLNADRLTRKVSRSEIAEVAAYTAMLLIDAAASGWYSTFTLKPNSFARTYFELIVAASMRKLCGGRTMRFGAPFPPGWPKDFPGRVRRLAEEFGLKPRDEEIATLASDNQQDGSLDVVSRLKLGDESGGGAYVLVQCATGVKWLTDKRGEPMMALWGRFVSWDGPRYKACAVPFTLRGAKELTRASAMHEDAIILDRIRIACGEPDKGIDAELRTSLAKWCRDGFKSCQKLASRKGALPPAKRSRPLRR